MAFRKLIKSLKTKPLSGEDIQDACNGECKIMVYSDLSQFKTLDELFGDYDCIALLYEMRPAFGHWTSLTRRGNSVEFFDPYGYEPDEQQEFISPAFRKISKQDKPYLAMLLLDSPYSISFNTHQFQKRSPDVSSCGRHVALRCILRQMPLKQFSNLVLSGKGINADDVVTQLTAFL